MPSYFPSFSQPILSLHKSAFLLLFSNVFRAEKSSLSIPGPQAVYDKAGWSEMAEPGHQGNENPSNCLGKKSPGGLFSHLQGLMIFCVIWTSSNNPDVLSSSLLICNVSQSVGIVKNTSRISHHQVITFYLGVYQTWLPFSEGKNIMLALIIFFYLNTFIFNFGKKN